MLSDCFPIKLFERTGFANESGTTLAIAPNAARVHNSWGINLEEIGGVETIQVSFELYSLFDFSSSNKHDLYIAHVLTTGRSGM